ncbi:indolepyruvate ferredoxin oxidoreductase beta subunit [Thermodesulfitimonas autotrophica]|uniref:Indolepyruvate ferredoxin oxidoreductase beta subunit n=1 Tax=Thermodesulfitimonas autotrophica TaxID=1894989 RepID=A0A3N5B0T5_9THEO|nr:2-oxoacid:acceptor oxidoreductase family protein [Thermodesulfitimonas autotrophica]RPF42452.1 indolepyruvate ferredoxin oxidoreductase beta subunit [Thermodesulfitimonas autotrophica]
MSFDVVIAGVGGQGNILATRVFARAAVAAGFGVLTSESVGMAQRGGPVASHVRIGHDLSGAIIPDGKADLVIGLELAETARVLPKLRSGGQVIAATTVIQPPALILTGAAYDAAAIAAYLREAVPGLLLIDAADVATRAGNRRTANSVLLGAASTLGSFLPFAPELLLPALLESLPPGLQEVNRHAFTLGRQEAERIRTAGQGT